MILNECPSLLTRCICTGYSSRGRYFLYLEVVKSFDVCVCVCVCAFVSVTQAVERVKTGSCNMLRHSCVALLSFVVVATSDNVLMNAASGEAAAHSDFTLSLRPPESTAHDIEESLAAMMKAEKEKRQLSDNEFEVAKQHLINAEKHRIHDIVQNAFGTLF